MTFGDCKIDNIALVFALAVFYIIINILTFIFLNWLKHLDRCNDIDRKIGNTNDITLSRQLNDIKDKIEKLDKTQNSLLSDNLKLKQENEELKKQLRDKY